MTAGKEKDRVAFSLHGRLGDPAIHAAINFHARKRSLSLSLSLEDRSLAQGWDFQLLKINNFFLFF